MIVAFKNTQGEFEIWQEVERPLDDASCIGAGLSLEEAKAKAVATLQREIERVGALSVDDCEVVS